MRRTKRIDWSRATEQEPVPGHPEVKLERFYAVDGSTPCVGLIVETGDCERYWFFGESENDDCPLPAGELRRLGLNGVIRSSLADDATVSGCDFVDELTDLIWRVEKRRQREERQMAFEQEVDEQLLPHSAVTHWVVYSPRGFRNELTLVPCESASAAGRIVRDHRYACIIDEDMTRTLMLGEQEDYWADDNLGCQSSIVASYACDIDASEQNSDQSRPLWE